MDGRAVGAVLYSISLYYYYYDDLRWKIERANKRIKIYAFYLSRGHVTYRCSK